MDMSDSRNWDIKRLSAQFQTYLWQKGNAKTNQPEKVDKVFIYLFSLKGLVLDSHSV